MMQIVRHRFKHEVPDIRASNPCIRNALPRDNLSIMGINDESNANNFTVPAR